jgi:hypothetical protein
VLVHKIDSKTKKLSLFKEAHPGQFGKVNECTVTLSQLLTLKISPDPIELKRTQIEQLKGFRMVCLFIQLTQKPKSYPRFTRHAQNQVMNL